MGTLFGLHGQQVLSVESNASGGHLIGRISYQHIAQGTLSCTILSHQGMNLARIDRQIDSFQYLFAIDAGMQVFYL